MQGLNRLQIAFDFFQRHLETEDSFTAQDLKDEAGWAYSSVTTYFSKQWREILRRDKPGVYRVRPEFRRLTFAEFQRRFTQNRELFASYDLRLHREVLTYELLLPLTRETQLRQALDDLFYADAVRQRLLEIDSTVIEEWLPSQPGEEKDDHLERVCELVSQKFSGYSIGHVGGRFRVGPLRTRANSGQMSAEGLPYLIDETTAVVRFILPLDSSRRTPSAQLLGPGLSAEKVTLVASAEELAKEESLLRSLFFHLFVAAVIRTVNGEEEIWLLEEGRRRRLYVYDRR
jgi:hypothetical protein